MLYVATVCSCSATSFQSLEDTRGDPCAGPIFLVEEDGGASSPRKHKGARTKSHKERETTATAFTTLKISSGRKSKLENSDVEDCSTCKDRQGIR